MLAFIVRRILYAVGVLFGVNVLIFFLFFSVNSPDNIARLNLGRHVSADAIEKWKQSHGYEQPLWINTQKQGAEMVTETLFWQRSIPLMRFDLGRTDSGRNIAYQIQEKVFPTLTIMIPLIVLSLTLSVCVAIAMVYARGSILDVFGQSVCIVLMSISSLFYIVAGQWFFSKDLRIFPHSGLGEGWDAVRFLILPVIVGVSYQLGGEIRLFRSILLEESERDYVRTARAKGLNEWKIFWRHIIPNASLPIITHVTSFLPYAVMGSMLLESFFGIPGLGNYTMDAIAALDFPSLQAMTFLGAVLYIVAYLLSDILCAVADPRIRLT